MTMPFMKPRKKNPVLRTRQMNLPPWARGRTALALTAAAAEGRFELQVCQRCRAVQYPPRDGQHRDDAQQREHQRVDALGREQEQQPAGKPVHHNSGWSGRRLFKRDFLRRNKTRLLPSVYSRTRVSSQPRYSASMDSRVDALSRVTSGGSRNGIHSYSSDMSATQPAGSRLHRGAGRLVTGRPPRAR